MWRRSAVLLVTVLAHAADRDPASVLQQVRSKVLETSKSLVNYTCVETVTRNYFRPAASRLPRACPLLMELRTHPTPDLELRPFSTDRLRLEVTIVDRGEIYSWAGASRFNDAGIYRLVRGGPIGTGAFGGFLITVFFADPKKFGFLGNRTLDGRKLLEYSFNVPASDSHYEVKLKDSWYHTAYTGVFLVDPETSDVVRMTVQTGELPAAAECCQSNTTLDFENVEIGRYRFLLATRSRQHWIYPTGDEAENTTVFSSCREYLGQSSVTFLPEGGAAPSAEQTRALSRPSAVPEGLRLAFALDAAIDVNTAAAGDAFTGHLTEPLRDRKGKGLAPKGALVEGRLLRVETFANPQQAFVVMRPDAVETKGGKLRLAALRDWQRIANESRSRKGVPVYLPAPGEDRAGVFQFPGDRVLIPKGFRSEWRTIMSSPESPGSQE